MPRRLHAVRTLAAQPPPVGIYASKYDPRLGAYICARLAAGESLKAICRGDPAMPTEKTVWNWARAHPRFRAMKDAAMAAVRAQARARHAARIAAKEARWAARAAVSSDGRSRVRRASGCTLELTAAICDRLCQGEPLYVLCRDPAMPSLGTVYNWLRAHPEFREAYARAKEVAFDVIVEDAAERAPWLGTEASSMRGLARIEAAAHGRCGKLAPRTYGRGPYGPLE